MLSFRDDQQDNLSVKQKHQNNPFVSDPLSGAKSTGLGLESAKRLSAAGATVVMTSRTPSKGEKAIESVKDYLNDQGMQENTSKIFSLTLDLDDLSSVKSFPARFKELGLSKIDVLMNNAGVSQRLLHFSFCLALCSHLQRHFFCLHFCFSCLLYTSHH